MKLSSIIPTILTCTTTLFLAASLLDASKLTRNGFLIGLILGIFMIIGMWKTIKPNRKYKYPEGLRISVFVTLFSLFSFVIFTFILTFFLTIVAGALNIEALSDYINSFVRKLPSLILSVVIINPIIIILMFTIPAVFLLTNRNKEIWED